MVGQCYLKYLVTKYMLLIFLTNLSYESNDRVGESMYCFLSYKKYFNLLAPELFFLILAHPVYKM